MTGRPVVVGVDGSAKAAVAIRWAVAEGTRRGVPVHAVLAWSLLDQRDGFDPHHGEPQAAERLEQALTEAVGAHAGDIVRSTPCDLAASALVDASEQAALVAVGARGQGGFPGLLLGSTADRVVQRAACPVVVVRSDERPGLPVVVGVDGSESSVAALRFAAEEARCRDGALEVVGAWDVPALAEWVFEDDAPIFAKLASGTADLIDRAVEEAGCADLSPIRTVVRGGAAGALVDASERARLVVVGSRGLGGVAGALIGSVSRQLVHHAASPVAVVPPLPL